VASLRRIAYIWALLAFVSPAASAVAQSPVLGDTRTPDTEQLARLERGLATEIEVDFAGTPLRQVVELLNDLAGVDVRTVEVDHPSTPISMQAGRHTIETVLNHISRVTEYDWGIEEDDIVIRPQDSVSNRLFNEIYDVEDILLDPRYGVVLSRDIERLEKAVLRSVDGWNPEDDGATLTNLNIAGRVHLLVRQTFRHQRAIAKLLKRLEEIAENVDAAQAAPGERPNTAPRSAPQDKPATTGLQHGAMLTGQLEGEEARMRVAIGACINHGVGIYELVFHGTEKSRVTVYEVTDPKKHPERMGTLHLSRADRIGLNNWLTFVRAHDPDAATSGHFEIRWIVDDETLATEVFAYFNGYDRPKNSLAPWELVGRFQPKPPEHEAPILAK
jgi:hypothetical protein